MKSKSNEKTSTYLKVQAQTAELSRRVEKFNPYRDPATGRFSSGGGGGARILGGSATNSYIASYLTFARETSIDAEKKSDRANKSTAAMSNRQRGDLYRGAAEAHDFASAINREAARLAKPGDPDPTNTPKYFQSRATYHTGESKRYADIVRARFSRD
jgi:hypothetical protein